MLFSYRNFKYCSILLYKLLQYKRVTNRDLIEVLQESYRQFGEATPVTQWLH